MAAYVSHEDAMSRLARLRAMHGMATLNAGATSDAKPEPSSSSPAFVQTAFLQLRELKRKKLGKPAAGSPRREPSPPPKPKPPVAKAVILKHRARCWNCGASGMEGSGCFGRRFNTSCIHWHAARGFEWIKWDDFVPKAEEPFWTEELYNERKKQSGRSEREIEDLFG